MTGPLRKMYLDLLDGGGADPVLHQRVFAYGVRHRDHRLLAELAAHPDIDPAVDAALSRVPNLRVRLAWARHPRRSADELVDVLRDEKRIRVLVALAERQDPLPLSVYALMFEQASAAGSSALALRIAAAAQAPRHLRVEAAALYAAEVSAVRRDDLVLLARAMRWNEVLATHTALPALARLLISDPALSPAAVGNLAEVLVPGVVDEMLDDCSWVGFQRELRTLMTLLDHPNLARRAVADVLSKLEDAAPLLARQPFYGGLTLTDVIDHARATLRTALEKPTSRSRPRSPVTLQRRRLAALGPPSVAGVVAAAGEPSLTGEQLGLLIGLCPADRDSPRMLAAAVSDRPAMMAQVLARFPAALDDPLLAGACDPAATLAALCRIAEPGDLHLFARVTSSRFMTSDLVPALPVRALVRTSPGPVVAAEVRLLLAASLGSDAAWEAFEVLAPDFEGSFGDFLAALAALS